MHRIRRLLQGLPVGLWAPGSRPHRHRRPSPGEEAEHRRQHDRLLDGQRDVQRGEELVSAFIRPSTARVLQEPLEQEQTEARLGQQPKRGEWVMRYSTIVTTAMVMAALSLGSLESAAAASPAPANSQPVLNDAKAKEDKKDKGKKDKNKCHNFRHPCQPEPLQTEVIPTSSSGDAMPKWFYLVNAVEPPSTCSYTYTNGTMSKTVIMPLVLTDQSSTLGYGAQLSLQCLQPGLRGQLWRAEPYGNGYAYLHSDLGNHLVLSTRQACGAGSDAVQAVVLYPEQDPHQTPTDNNAFQLWNYVKTGSFSIDGQPVPVVEINNSTCPGGPLFVQSGQSVYVGSDSGNIPPTNQWFAWPNYPLEAVLAQSPAPYPTGVGDQVTAYDYIMEQLSFPTSTCSTRVEELNYTYTYTGIRCEYTNPAYMLLWSNYASQVQTLAKDQPPLGVSAQSWSDVTSQLSTELQDVALITGFYSTLHSTSGTLANQNQDDLNTLIDDVLGSPPPTDTVIGAKSAAVNGIVYTALSAAGPELSVFANLMEAAVNSATAANSGNLTGQFVTTTDQLWSTLSATFATVNTAFAQQATAILLDWGKLQQMKVLVSSTGPGSLELTPDKENAYVDLAAKGFAVSAMQMLLPVRYHLTRLTSQANGNPIDFVTNSPPSYAQYAQLVGTQTNDSNYQVWHKYYISDNKGNYPSQDALQRDVFGNGVSPSDFFLATNGWEGFTTLDQYLDCNGVLTNITNWTGNSLTVSVDPVQGVIGGNDRSLSTDVNGDGVGTVDEVEGLPLPPYASILLGSAFAESGLETIFYIYDSSYSSSNSVANFQVHQYDCSDIREKTWADNLNYIGGYWLVPEPVTTQSGSSPGIIPMGVAR
jgi:hypothetical protein